MLNQLLSEAVLPHLYQNRLELQKLHLDLIPGGLRQLNLSH